MRRLVPLPPMPCEHLHDTTTRYDQTEKPQGQSPASRTATRQSAGVPRG
ncbi:MAG: hypothetical protein ACRDL4_06420 [Thermoleophilaceae bacterium]